MRNCLRKTKDTRDEITVEKTVTQSMAMERPIHEDTRVVVSDDSDDVGSRRSSPTRQQHAAVRSADGWNVFVRGLGEGASETALSDAFSLHGQVNIVRLNRDRRTGSPNYAIVELGTHREAQNAINQLHGKDLFGKKIEVHWAFVKPTSGTHVQQSDAPRICG